MKKTKMHYRIFKTKPHWAFVALTTGIVALSFEVGVAHIAHADTTTTSTVSTQVTTASATSVVQSSAASSATYSYSSDQDSIGTVASNIAAYDSYANSPHNVATTVNFTNGDSVVSSNTYYAYQGNEIAYQLDGPSGYNMVNTPNIKAASGASTVNVPVLPNGVVTVVKFVENGQLVGQRAYNTKPNTPIDYTADIEQGYHAVNGPTINSGTTSQTYTVNIERGQITTTFQFMHGNDVVGTRQFTGGTNSNIYLNGDVPTGYRAESDAPIYAGYGDQTVQVQLIKDPFATDPGDHDDNGSGADSSASSHSHSKASSAHSHASHTASHASSASHSASSQTNGKVKYHAVNNNTSKANKAKSKLPQTGESENARNASILGGLMVLLSFGLYGASKRKRKD